MLTFQDVLVRWGIAAGDVNVMPRSPYRKTFQTVLPALVRIRRAAIDAGQAAQRIDSEPALKQGRRWVVSFGKVAQDVASSPLRMFIAGLYRNDSHRPRTHADILAKPDGKFMREMFNPFHLLAPGDDLQTHTWFDPSLSERWAVGRRMWRGRRA